MGWFDAASQRLKIVEDGVTKDENEIDEIKNRISDVELIKTFDSDDYSFNSALTEGDRWVFTRG